jgi:hypothetical protein
MTRTEGARQRNRQITGSFGRSTAGGQATQRNGSTHRKVGEVKLPALCLFLPGWWSSTVIVSVVMRRTSIHRRRGAVDVRLVAAAGHRHRAAVPHHPGRPNAMEMMRFDGWVHLQALVTLRDGPCRTAAWHGVPGSPVPPNRIAASSSWRWAGSAPSSARLCSLATRARSCLGGTGTWHGRARPHRRMNDGGGDGSLRQCPALNCWTKRSVC